MTELLNTAHAVDERPLNASCIDRVRDFTLFTADCTGSAKNAIYPHEKKISCAADLAEAAQFDHVAARYIDNRRAKIGFIESDVLPLDLDNEHSENPADWKSIDDLKKAFLDVGFYVVPSRNDGKPKGNKAPRPRLHVYFPIENATDAGAYEALKAEVLERFPFDPNAKDAARFLFGTENARAVAVSGKTSLTEFLEKNPRRPDAAAPTVSQSKKESNTAPPLDWTPFQGATFGIIPEGQRNNNLFKHACSLRAKGVLTDENALEILTAENERLCQPPLELVEVTTIAEQVCQYPQSRSPEFEATHSASSATQPIALESVSARDLASADLPPTKFIVNGLMPQGLNLIASPPKFGKSWLALDLCLSVAAGQPFLGYQTNQCGALYLALEDSYNRLKDRLKKVWGNDPPPSDFDLAITAPPLDAGLVQTLDDYCNEHPQTELIVIDTLQKVRGAARRTETSYGSDYRELGVLKRFADQRGLCVVLIHHLRKAIDDGDPFARISGTNGVFGAIDTAFVLTKSKREDDETLLTYTGRDVDSDSVYLRFDKSAYRWQLIGTQSAVNANRARADHETNPLVVGVKRLLATHTSWTGTTTAFRSALAEIGVFLDTDERTIGKFLRDAAPKLRAWDDIVFKPTASGGRNGRTFLLESVQRE